MVRTDLILPLINVFLLTSAGAIVLLLAEKRWKLLSSFRLEKSSALNLAVARVVIMTTLVSKISLNYELSYSRLDRALIVPPLGWAYLAAYVPRNPNLISVLYVLFVAFGALAIAGLYGRLACCVTSAVGFYLLTLPQLFGKINHDHNLILFGFILAASPCCDTFSVDAIRDALRAAKHGHFLTAPTESTVYADPLKAMMVLLGLIYFFPGAWKVGRAGVHWFSADNMRWMMARKLLEAPHITSIQMWAMHHPLLLVMGAAFTPLFELGFLFAILSPRTRPYAAACGIAFHNMTALLMNISFVSLQMCYVIFVNWTRVLSWIALRFRIGQIRIRRVGPGELPFLNIITALDWMNRISIDQLTTSKTSTVSSSRAPLADGDTQSLTITDEEGTRLSGSEAYICITKRIVLLWPMYLCLSVPVLRTAGESFYGHLNRIRQNRALKIAPEVETSTSNRPLSMLFRPLVATFVFGMILAGLTHSVNAWPIACYPTFDHVETGEVSELFATATSDDGRVYRQNLSFDTKIGDKLAAERYDAMVDNLMRQDVPVSKQRAAAIVNLWRESYAYPNFKEVTLYCDTFTLDRDGRPGPLIQNREITHLSQRDGIQ
jgi:hypothetical protein